MEGAKPWQIVVIVVGLLAAAGSIVFQFVFAKDKVTLADTITLVDVTSGDLFKAPLPKNKAIGFPAKNPNTKESTLLPVVPREGKWYLDHQVLPGLEKNMKIEMKAVLDFKSGEVRTNGNTPKSVDVF